MLRLPKFTYHRPATAAEAVKLAFAHGPEAQYVAGGTDLYPNMKRRVQRPTEVIALSGCADMRGIEGDAKSGFTIGAGSTLTEIEEHPGLQESHPAFTHAVREISTPLLRNMGTIGGNLLLDTRCNYYDQSHEWRESIDFCKKCDGEICWVAPSSPRCWAVQSSDSVPVLSAMDAEVTILGPDGERRIAVRDLYKDDGIDYTTLPRGELVTKLHLPVSDGWKASYHKLRRRGTFDFPVLGIGACLWFDGDTVTRAEIRIGGAGSYPIPATKCAEMLVGQKLTAGDAASEELITAAAQEAFKPTRAMDNTDHEASWRKKMAPIFVARALRDCL